MKERDGSLEMTLPIFQYWLKEIGITKLITSTLADDLEQQLNRAEEEAFVKAGEIEPLIKSWGLYRGKQITGETVRAWLDQLKDVYEQRLLFKLLTRLKFVSTTEILEKFESAHERIVNRLAPAKLRESKSEKRRDLCITYVDGPGKSGNQYARMYAKENEILLDCVVEPGKLTKRLSPDGIRSSTSAVIVVDDLVGTGRTLADGLTRFLAENGQVLVQLKIPLVVVALYATIRGQKAIEETLAQCEGLSSRFYPCQILDDENFGFPESGIGFWRDQKERDRAKAVCTRLGTHIYAHPLGVGNEGLLLTFPDTCPNNALPILFASRSGTHAWFPLFPRSAS